MENRASVNKNVRYWYSYPVVLRSAVEAVHLVYCFAREE